MPDQPGTLARTEQLERLLEISRSLASNLDLPSLLQNIVEAACQLTGSEGASILLYDANLGRLRFEAIPAFQEEDLRGINVPIDNSVAGWIFKNSKPLIINAAQHDPRIYREVDRRVHFDTRSILGVPLLIKREPIGVLEAVNKLGNGDYTEADLDTLGALAGPAAIAIENARLLAKLQQANEELTRLDRMKSDFIAIASHELRTPLGLILGHATFLHEVIAKDHRDQVEVIVRSAERLKSIVEDMSRITHKEEGRSRVHHEAFSIGSLVEEMVTRFSELAEEKGIELGCDVPEGDALEVEADREKIEVVLSNLVRNALMFTDAGGQVGVKAEGSGDYVKVFVVDTGIGIPAADIERVFDRFYQVESHLTRKHGGMGLGLSIAKAMVEMHNGQIWCESKEGVGSLFCFMLPVSEEKAQASAKVFRSG
jgi:signal transduction histidine kinase